MPDLTTASHPTEYARPPVYDRVPSVEAIERLQTQPRLTQAKAMTHDLPAAVRATL
jgi:hypothetical protein